MRNGLPEGQSTDAPPITKSSPAKVPGKFKGLVVPGGPPLSTMSLLADVPMICLVDWRKTVPAPPQAKPPPPNAETAPVKLFVA